MINIVVTPLSFMGEGFKEGKSYRSVTISERNLVPLIIKNVTTLALKPIYGTFGPELWCPRIATGPRLLTGPFPLDFRLTVRSGAGAQGGRKTCGFTSITSKVVGLFRRLTN